MQVKNKHLDKFVSYKGYYCTYRKDDGDDKVQLFAKKGKKTIIKLQAPLGDDFKRIDQKLKKIESGIKEKYDVKSKAESICRQPSSRLKFSLSNFKSSLTTKLSSNMSGTLQLHPFKSYENVKMASTKAGDIARISSLRMSNSERFFITTPQVEPKDEEIKFLPKPMKVKHVRFKTADFPQSQIDDIRRSSRFEDEEEKVLWSGSKAVQTSQGGYLQSAVSAFNFKKKFCLIEIFTRSYNRTVLEAVDKSNFELVVIKIINKQALKANRAFDMAVRNSTEAWKNLNHAMICKLEYVAQTDQKVEVITSDLYDT